MFKVRLQPPESDFETGRPILKAEILDGNFREWYSKQDLQKDFQLDINRDRKPRSKDANSYFHVLCGKIADRIGTSKAEVKNKMISLYGQPDLIDGGLNYMIVRDEMDVGKFEHLHLQPTAQTQVLNGKLYRVYIVMRGVGIKRKEKTYDTREMSILIDGIISEARDAGLTEAEIMSTREKAILKEVYGID